MPLESENPENVLNAYFVNSITYCLVLEQGIRRQNVLFCHEGLSIYHNGFGDANFRALRFEIKRVAIK